MSVNINRTGNHKIDIDFPGQKFWEFYGSSLKASGSLADLGLPSHVMKIDAASEWTMGESKFILLFR